MQSVDSVSALADQKITLSRFDRHEAHYFARHRLADCLSVGTIRLASFHEWFDIGRGE